MFHFFNLPHIVGIYLSKVVNGNIRTMREIYSKYNKDTTTTSSTSFADFEQVNAS